MSEENSFLFAECAHPVTKRGKMRGRRTALVLAYALFAIVYAAFFIAISLPQPIAILPLFVWMLVFFTWRTVSYECCVRTEGGRISFLRLYGKKEKLLYSFPIASIVQIDEAKGEQIAHDLRADPPAGGGYVAVIRTDGGEESFAFDASDGVLRVLRYYNKAAFTRG